MNFNGKKLVFSAVLAMVAVAYFGISFGDETVSSKNAAFDFETNIKICLLLTDNIKKFRPPTIELESLLKENLELVSSKFISVESSDLSFTNSDFSWEEMRNGEKHILTAQGWKIKVSAKLKAKGLEEKDWLYINFGKGLREMLTQDGLSLYFLSNEFEKRDQPFQKASDKFVVAEFKYSSILNRTLLILLSWLVITVIFYNLKLG